MLRKTAIFWLVVVPSFLLLYASLWGALLLRYSGHLDSHTVNSHLQAFSVIFLFWLVVFFIHGLYEIATFRRYTTLIFNLISAMAVNLLVAIIYFYFQPELILTPRRFLLVEVGVAFLLLLGWMLLVKFFLKNRFMEDVYLFSFNNELKELEEEIHQRPYLGIRVLGHLQPIQLSSLKFQSNTALILPDNLHTQPEILRQFYEFRKHGINFYNHKNFYEDLLRRVYLSQLNEVWFLENIDYKEKRFFNFFKRLMDLVLGLVGLIFFVVTFPLVSLLIKLTSSGPVLFTQGRVGKNGKLFKVYKYRTMDRADYTTWTEVGDKRITKLGGFLRKTRIDEWPQFINLLKGDMSLVGPRPEQPGIVETLRQQIPFYDERHLVKPGLTGWAQLNVYAGSLEETKLKLQYDLYYIKHRSILFDLEIILKTLYTIFTWQGR